MHTFDLIRPKTKIHTVWLGSYGGHWDTIVIALDFPRNKKEDSWGKKILKIPDGSLTISPLEWENWFGSLNRLVEIGVLDENQRPFSVDVTKWVKAQIAFPCDEDGDILGLNFGWL